MSIANKTVMEVNHSICFGCMMCGDICPKGAISFPIQNDCFWYPAIDKNKCINCGVCLKKCPAIKKHLNSGEIDKHTVICFGAKTKKEELRKESTSGGFFSEIAYDWIKKGSYICGAVYDEKNQVLHKIGNTENFVERARQSKYVQSNIQGNYTKIKELLKEGKLVVFSGTPCQVEALHSFLGIELFESDSLLTIDFVCLGIASTVVYSKYLSFLEKKYGTKIKKVHFKDKREGWRSIGTSIQFENGKEYFRVGSRDSYMVAYVTDALCMRESCHSCPYRKVPHISDITLGDFWGIENVNPAIDDNKGLSAVLINTEKGRRAFQSISSMIEFFETDAKDIARGNFTIQKSKKPNPQRKNFLQDMYNESYLKVIRKYCSYKGINKLIIDAKYIKGSLKKSIRSFKRR